MPYTKGVWSGGKRYNFFRIHLPFNGVWVRVRVRVRVRVSDG